MLLREHRSCSVKGFSSPGTVDRLQWQTVKSTYQAHSYTIAAPESEFSSLSHRGNERRIYSVFELHEIFNPFTLPIHKCGS